MEQIFSDSSPVTVDTCNVNGKSLVAIGFLTGDIKVFSFNAPSSKTSDFLELSWRRTHKRSVRKARFGCQKSQNPRHLYTATQNKALVQWDIETGKKVRCLRSAHQGAPHSLCCIDHNSSSKVFVAAGDENGIIRLWDLDSTQPQICEFSDQEDYITDLAVSSDGRSLLATSGDTTLASYSFTGKKLQIRSELMASELLSLTVTDSVVANEGRVICGGAEGFLEVFKEKEYGNILERIESGHEDTVDCLTTISSDLVASGSTLDGSIRLIHLNPNRNLGQIACHEDGVEELATTSDKKWLISCGHDDKIKFTEMKPILKEVKSGKKKSRNLKKVKLKTDHFFDDME